MKRNFAAQPEGGGEITILTGRDLMTEVTPNTFEERVFQKRPLFVDNCKNCDSMKNITGNKVYADASNSKNSWLDDSLDLLKFGVTTWSDEQQRKSAQEQAEAALRIEQTQLAQERAKAEAEKAKSESMAARIKALATPIAITGAVVVVGIAAYFFFKKKKIN